MPRSKLKLSLEEHYVDSKDELEQSCDIGETTLKNGEFCINREGVRMGEVVQSNNNETVDYEDIEILEVLGRGCSGQVMKAKHRETGQLHAVKSIHNIYDKAQRDQLLTEIKTLYALDCPWLVKCYGAFFKDSSLSVVLEYCDAGSLDQVLKKTGPMPEDILASITYQLLSGLSFLRKNRRFHRDVKPQNILLNTDGYAKLTDFGLARQLDNSLAMANTFVGTFRYMSPERVQNKPYNSKSDIWSLGILLIECATGQYPYLDARSHIELVQSILDGDIPTVSTEYSREFQQFITDCLQKEPEDRLPASILLGSPWITKHVGKDPDGCIDRIQEWMYEFF